MRLTRDVLRLLAAVNERGRGDVTLRTMAELANRSPYDLHRRFRRATGETPKGYTSRVRLSRAAADLVGTDTPVASIAAAHGFSGHEVFTRAFTRRFGMSPRAYRDRGLAGDLAGTAAAGHAAVVTAVAPCVGLYRTVVVDEKELSMSTEVSVQDLPALHALIMRRRVPREQIADTLGEILPALFGHAQSAGLAMSGPPFTRYPEVGMGTLLLEGGVQLAEPAGGELPEGMEALTIPAGRAATTLHVGPYERLQEAYGALEAYLEREGLKAAGPSYEIYLTDPGERPDPETWETQVVQPLV